MENQEGAARATRIAREVATGTFVPLLGTLTARKGPDRLRYLFRLPVSKKPPCLGLSLKNEEDQSRRKRQRRVKDGSGSAGKKPGSSVGCERRNPPERSSISGLAFFQGKSVFVPSKPSWQKNVGGAGHDRDRRQHAGESQGDSDGGPTWRSRARPVVGPPHRGGRGTDDRYKRGPSGTGRSAKDGLPR